ncbi:MAG: pyridoxamine 5'-phosphate oxidase family protein [Chloroflexota bacterium]
MTVEQASALQPAHRLFLDAPRVAVVATVGAAGDPRQSTVWYRLEPDDTILLNSRVTRRWSQDLRRTGRISLAVPDAASGYRWLGLACRLVATDDDLERALADIVALHRRYHEGLAGPEVEADYRAHARISFRVRAARVHDHLGDA